MTTYRAGLVGCGRIGTLWETDPPTPLTHAGALAVCPRTLLVAGSSRGFDHLQHFGHQWKIDALYLDYREMLDKENLDIVSIATHPGLHPPIVEAAVAAGVKGIFCEKPLALSLEDGDAIVRACRDANVVLSVNHSRRWNPVFLEAKRMIEEGVIGDLISMFGVCQGVKPFPAWTADEEGPLLHDAVHAFDLFRLYAGEVDWVVGTAHRRKHPFRVEDISDAIFTFKNGVSAVAMVNELTKYARFGVELQGTDGVIRLEYGGNQWWLAVERTNRLNEPDPRIEWYMLEPRPFPETPQVSPIGTAIEELVDCIENGGEPSSNGEDGVASLEMVMAIYESQRQGNCPVSLPLRDRSSQLIMLREAGYF
ncbi:MAG: Gfo/Idh/MocA family oxidoreductase [Caldilineaceae bacterium]|nr:Gfo/Idh/MocA family oxidoreductase [Caldilineaceae bacterium]